MKDAQYWKEYRKLHGPRLNARKRERYQARIGVVLEDGVKPPKPKPIAIPNTESHPCHACRAPTTRAFIVAGSSYWLCNAHAP